jgi:hypothetical protein
MMTKAKLEALTNEVDRNDMEDVIEFIKTLEDDAYDEDEEDDITD